MKNKKILYIIIFSLIISIMSLTVAYSALSVILKVTGTAQVQQASWDIHFNNIKVKDGSVTATKKATILSPQQVDFSVTLNKPGDFYEFTVDIVNKGSIDAMIDSIVKTPNLTPTQQKYLIYEITYSDGNSVGLKQLLKANKLKTLKVRLAYKTDLIASDLPTTPDNLNLSFQAIFIQADSSNIVGPEGSGRELPVVRMVSGDISNPKMGDMFAIKNERFHIFNSTETTVTGIAEYNLYVGGEKEGTTIREYGPEATGIQNSEMRGTISGLKIMKGVTAYSTIGNAYKGSIVEGYVNNYHDILTSYGVKIEEARIITENEVVNIFKCPINGQCPETYPWIYATTYWTNSPFDKDYVGIVFSNKVFMHNNYDRNGSRGVRPVITILKSEFK